MTNHIELLRKYPVFDKAGEPVDIGEPEEIAAAKKPEQSASPSRLTIQSKSRRRRSHDGQKTEGARF